MDHNNATAAAVAAGVAAYGLIIGLIALGLIVLSFVVYWRIAAKAGYNGALSLLMIVPVVNFAILLIFAFTEWPIEQQLRSLKSGTPPIGPGAPPSTPGWQPPMAPPLP